jgi:hypothetical protein
MAEATGRQEWDETAPDGARFRVVITPRGEFLRGSASSDFVTAAAEVLVGLVAGNGSYKVGVFKQHKGVLRLVHKDKTPDVASALTEAGRIRLLLREGKASEITG